MLTNENIFPRYGRVAGVFERDGGGVLLAEVGEDLFRGSQELFALGCGVVDGIKSDRAADLQEFVRVLEHRAGPLDGGDDLWRADASVLVGIDEVERLGIELDAARGAGFETQNGTGHKRNPAR